MASQTNYKLPLAFQNACETGRRVCIHERETKKIRWSYDKMLIDWVRSGRTGKYSALGQDARTSLRSVRTSWPRAKYFPVRPSHSVNKYIEFTNTSWKICHCMSQQSTGIKMSNWTEEVICNSCPVGLFNELSQAPKRGCFPGGGLPYESDGDARRLA